MDDMDRASSIAALRAALVGAGDPAKLTPSELQALTVVVEWFHDERLPAPYTTRDLQSLVARIAACLDAGRR